MLEWLKVNGKLFIRCQRKSDNQLGYWEVHEQKFYPVKNSYSEAMFNHFDYYAIESNGITYLKKKEI